MMILFCSSKPTLKMINDKVEKGTNSQIANIPASWIRMKVESFLGNIITWVWLDFRYELYPIAVFDKLNKCASLCYDVLLALEYNRTNIVIKAKGIRLDSIFRLRNFICVEIAVEINLLTGLVVFGFFDPWSAIWDSGYLVLGCKSPQLPYP